MIVTVAYPKTATSTFNHDYYVSKHVPLVGRLWGPMGLRSTRVLKGTGSLGGAPAYELICLLDFPSQEAFNQAAGAHADEVMGDIRNFTNVEPIVQFNEPVAV
jgi:uncharacterized protein (TIGR02118 family)